MNTFPEITFFHYSFNRAERVFAIGEQTLPYLDLTYCVEGQMRYVFEGEEYTLSSGDAILYPVGSVRIRRETDTPALYASFNVRFAEELVPPVKGVLRKSVRSDTVQMLESIKKAHLSVGEMKNEKSAALFYYLYYQLIETARENEHPHIKHMKNVAGIDVIAVGSDFDGITGNTAMKDASELTMLIDTLDKSGFTDGEIEKICWGNAMRVIKDVL